MFGPKPFGLTVKVNAVDRRAAAAELMDLARELQTGELKTAGVRTGPAADTSHKVEYRGCPSGVASEVPHG